MTGAKDVLLRLAADVKSWSRALWLCQSACDFAVRRPVRLESRYA